MSIKINKLETISTIEEARKIYNGKVDWNHLTTNFNLSEGFMKKYQEHFNFHALTYWQVFSDSFIDEFSHKIDWGWISLRHKLSREIMIKYIDKIDAEFLEENHKIPKETKQEIITLKNLTS